MVFNSLWLTYFQAGHIRVEVGGKMLDRLLHKPVLGFRPQEVLIRNLGVVLQK